MSYFVMSYSMGLPQEKMSDDMLQWLVHQSQEGLLHPFSLLFCFLLLYVFLFRINRVGTNGKNLPPAPWKLPIIGNLHQLLSPFPHRGLHSLAQHHGPLMLLHLGSKPTLVVSSPDAAREIMKTHDLIFSSRPNSSFVRRLFYNHKDVTFAPSGEYWRYVRRICIIQLLSLKKVQFFQPVREEETKAMIENIQKSCSSSSSFSALVDLSEVLMSLTNDIICRVALGKKYGGEEGSGRRFGQIMSELSYLVGVFNVGDFIPWLAWVNSVIGLEKRVEKISAEIDSFLDEVIEDHINGKRRKEDGVNDVDGGGQDFVDFLLQIQQDDQSAEITLGRENIKGIILDMFAAGTDTSHSLLVWTMVRLLKHPEVMEEVQKEVRRVVLATGKANISENDIEQMHYLKAVIKETLRMHPPFPLLLQHESTEDAKIQGYDIPSNTTVIINAWAIGRDPSSWDEPEQFKPTRFLNDATSIDFKGHDFQLIPFGAGRRGCPGAHFAIASVELALASLLHKFDWALPNTSPNGGEALDITESSGVVSNLKTPLLAVAIPRY